MTSRDSRTGDEESSACSYTNDSHLKNDGTSVGATAPLSHTMARTHDAGVLSYLRLSTDNRSWLRQPARGEPAEPPDPRADPRV